MERKAFLNSAVKQKPRILVAPLDWGLGHAARCIPIISALLDEGADVILAADGRSYDMLEKEFPGLSLIRFPGYGITYGDGSNSSTAVAMQVPKIIRSIVREHTMLPSLLREYNIDAVISDNRFGLFHRSVPCVFLTHQLRILAPRPYSWIEKPLYHLQKMLIHRYRQCWIPDVQTSGNLSGKLSHSYALPRNARFIGPLTRFKKEREIGLEYDLLAVLSGPEPQRTTFETLLFEQLQHLSMKCLIVRGTPEKTQQIKLRENILVLSSLTSEAMNKAFLASRLIVARPGYSTLMDLSAVGNKAILVPTPGQTEQEYLAMMFKEKNIFYSVSQKDFNIVKAMKEAEGYTGLQPIAPEEPLEVYIHSFLLPLCKRTS